MHAEKRGLGTLKGFGDHAARLRALFSSLLIRVYPRTSAAEIPVSAAKTFVLLFTHPSL